MQMIKASVEKQSLVVMIKAPPVWRSFVYNVKSRASHPGMNQKRERTSGGTCVSSWLEVASVVLHAMTSLTYVVVAVARRLGYIGRSGTDGVIRWLIYALKGGET